MPDNPCRGTFFLIKLQGWILDLRFYLKEVSTRDIFLCINQRFIAFSVRSNVDSGFSKIAGCAPERRTLSKPCCVINFLKNVLLRQLFFGTFSENNLWWSLFEYMCCLYTVDLQLYWNKLENFKNFRNQ